MKLGCSKLQIKILKKFVVSRTKHFQVSNLPHHAIEDREHKQIFFLKQLVYGNALKIELLTTLVLQQLLQYSYMCYSVVVSYNCPTELQRHHSNSVNRGFVVHCSPALPVHWSNHVGKLRHSLQCILSHIGCGPGEYRSRQINERAPG